ncbi:MAG: hypothetical protein JRN20_19025 [Nitrososphaerota archaeon]|nr:hypothetical protein [Nitrososphaerota archaeon]
MPDQEHKDMAFVWEEVKILASTSSTPKLMDEISLETNIPLDICEKKVMDLVDLGLLTVQHDSDLYGHELVRYVVPSKRKYR